MMLIIFSIFKDLFLACEQVIKAPFLFCVILFCIGIKIVLLKKFLAQYTLQRASSMALGAIIFIFMSEFLSDISWAFESLHSYFASIYYSRLEIALVRISWAFYVLEFQSLSFLLEYLVKNNYLKKRHYILCTMSVGLTVYFICVALLHYSSIGLLSRKSEIFLMKLTCMYNIFLVLFSFAFIFKKLYKSTTFPLIIKKQIMIFIVWFIIPKIILEQLNNNLWTKTLFDPSLPFGNFGQASITTLLSTYALYFCLHKVMRLRFLNTYNHVKELGVRTHIFTTYIRKLMPKILLAQNQQQLHELTQVAFKDLFQMNFNAIMMWVDPACFAYEYFALNSSYAQNKIILENMNAYHHPIESVTGEYLYENRIVIRDELEFSYYYTADEKYKKLLEILHSLNADIFIPLYENHTLLAAIIIEHGARKELYSDIERDEMICFGQYIIMSLTSFKAERFENLTARIKMLDELVYYKNKECEHYQEALENFKSEVVTYKPAVLLYQDKKLIPCHPEVTQTLECDFSNEHHPVYETLFKTAQTVEQYKQSISSVYRIKGEKDIRLVATPLNNKAVSVIALPLNALERIKHIQNFLKEPSDFFYIFFLETTKIGKLIAEFIPGNDYLLLYFKIMLLKAILSKKQLLLQVPQEDMRPLVTFIHELSESSTLYFVALTEPEQKNEIALKLFGMNRLFEGGLENGLLEKLQNQGTLCIENIHLLHIETQKLLSDFLRIGYFKPLRSSYLIASKVRIIGTTPYDIKKLVLEGTFDPELAQLLIPHTLTLSALLNYRKEEYNELMEGYAYQIIKTKSLTPLLKLTEEDKQVIYEKYPASLQELKEYIHKIITQKTLHKKLEHLVEFDPAASFTDQDLIQAARLGKHALKDSQLMTLLWQRFNNQSYIAQVLGVNRSSVHRRLKEIKVH